MKLIAKLGWLVPMSLLAVFGTLVYFLFFSGNRSESSGIAVSLCVTKCQKSLIEGVDAAKGPCLSNEIQTDWVCDMVHRPRQAVDDLPENQCSAYREGKAKHFVEVDPNCEVIKIY